MFNSGNTNNIAQVNNTKISTKDFMNFINLSKVPQNTIKENLNNNNIEYRPLICGSIGRQPFWIDRYGKTILKNADHVHE